MKATKAEKKSGDIEQKNVLVGVVGLSQMSVTILPDKSIHLVEHFIDPNYEMKEPFKGRAAMFSVIMNIRPEYVPQLLRILQENGIETATEPMPLPDKHISDKYTSDKHA